jgi:pimeloyl-ACP methyl ester carboxylesterase
MSVGVNMKFLFGLLVLAWSSLGYSQISNPVLIEVHTGREAGFISKSSVFQRAILLKPSIPSDTALLFYRGWSGIANIKSENDWHRNLNFLKNNTALFAQEGISLVVMDCPSDENQVAPGNMPLGCSDDFRSSQKHADDVRKIIAELKGKHSISKVFVMGHSYGSISSKWLAKNLGHELDGSIHSASQTLAGRNRAFAYSMASFDMGSLKAPVLHIHHADDQCAYTPYAKVLAYSNNNLITVKGGSPNGDVCGGGHYHSFEGREEVSSKAIIQWIKTGQVEAFIGN